MKYMKMALSAAFGDVFSVFLASICLPFLPMVPIQFLLEDLIYDLSQIAIPFDNVDKEFLEKPHKWDTSDLKKFMNVMGITASVVDLIAFAIFWFVLGFNSVSDQYSFQTAWFIEGVISQTMIVHFIRTEKIPFIQSTASKWLLLSTTLSIIASMIVPVILKGIPEFHFTTLPFEFYMYLIYSCLFMPPLPNSSNGYTSKNTTDGYKLNKCSLKFLSETTIYGIMYIDEGNFIK